MQLIQPEAVHRPLGTDDWLKTCALFVFMAKDFITFVESYRSSDSVGIEQGYQQFAPVWRALHQTQYIERHWRQQETLLQFNPLPILEDIRPNRTSSRYASKHGKGRLAIDESIELADRFYSMFPDVQKLEAFSNQSVYLGLAIMYKRMVNTINSLREVEYQQVCRTRSSPRCLAKKNAIYEMLRRLQTSRTIDI